MHDPLGLTRQTTYAKLSPEELESMGKQAAVAYLSKTVESLNDAVIKVARQHPSISTHQVRRIAEFANTETFSRLFSDNEKYASDKNIEFPVADPGDILHALNDGARPSFVESSDDYGCEPVKMSSASDVEADLALTKMFLGVDPASPGSEKTAASVIAVKPDGRMTVVDTILGRDKVAGAVADRILAAGEDGTRGRQAGSLLTSDDTHPAAGAKEDTYDEAAQTEKVSFTRGKALALGAGLAGTAGLGYLASKAGGPGSVSSKADTFNQAMEMYSKETGNPPEQMAHEDPYKWIRKAQGMSKAAMGGMPDMPMGPAGAAAGAGEASSSLDTTQHPEVTHASNIRALDRRVEIEKKKQELMAMQAKGMEAMGDQGGMGEGAAGAPMEEAPPAEAAPAESVPAEGAPAEAMPAEGEGMPQEAGMEAMPPQASAPAGGPGGMEPASNMPAPGENVKRASVQTLIKTAYGVGDYDISGDNLKIYQSESGRVVGPGKKERPWFYKDIPSSYRSKIQYSQDDDGKGAWNAEVSVPLSVAEGHPSLKSWVQKAKKKQASVDLTKQAMSYAKSNRPKAGAVLDDLRQATSVENIRKLASTKPQYKSANPYGDLIRAKQKVARLLDDAVAARDTNNEYFKEAQARFSDAVIRHLHDGGGMGEVTHMMGQVNPHEGAIKVGMTTVIPHIKKHGFDLSKLQAASIRYEMEKGASQRTVNVEHPVVQGYSDMLKIAGNQQVLNESAGGLQSKFNEIEGVLKEAMVRHVAAS